MQELFISIIPLILLIAVIYVVFKTYKVKNNILKWALIISMPFLFLPLIFSPPNSPMAIIPWMPFFISLLYSVIILIKRSIQLFVLKKKSIRIYQFIRPLLIIFLFFTIQFFQERSFRLTNKLAYELATEVNQSVQLSNDFTPPRSNAIKWENHTDYQLNWSDEKQTYYSTDIQFWPLYQRLNYDYNETNGIFHMAVRCGWQQVFYFRGAKDKELETFYSDELGTFRVTFNSKTGKYKKIN